MSCHSKGYHEGPSSDHKHKAGVYKKVVGGNYGLGSKEFAPRIWAADRCKSVYFENVVGALVLTNIQRNCDVKLGIKES